MAGLLEDSVEQGQSAFQGLGAAAEQAAQNQVRNTELDSARKELARDLVGKLGGTIESGVAKAGAAVAAAFPGITQVLHLKEEPDQIPKRRTELLGDTEDVSNFYLSTPEVSLPRDQWSQGIASLFSRADGGLLNNNAKPIGGVK